MSNQMTKDEILIFLVENCMVEHDMNRQDAEEYVKKNINDKDMQYIIDQTNQMISIAKSNPGVVDGMMEKLKDLT